MLEGDCATIWGTTKGLIALTLRPSKWFSSALVVMLTAFLTLAGVGPASAASSGAVSWSSYIGNFGGTETPAKYCAAGKVVVAVYTGRTDSQTFGFSCATLNVDGTVGAADSTIFYFPLAGGAGSTDSSYGFTSSCESGQAAVGIRLSQGGYLEAAQVSCASGPTYSSSVWGSQTTNRTYSFGTYGCSVNKFITGFKARTGGSVDAVLVGCASITNYGVPPTVSAFSGTSGAVSSTSQTLTLNFNTSIDGLSDQDFSFTGTASGCQASPDNTTGQTFTITISGCSEGNVTVSLIINHVSANDSAAILGPFSL